MTRFGCSGPPSSGTRASPRPTTASVSPSRRAETGRAGGGSSRSMRAWNPAAISPGVSARHGPPPGRDRSARAGLRRRDPRARRGASRRPVPPRLRHLRRYRLHPLGRGARPRSRRRRSRYRVRHCRVLVHRGPPGMPVRDGRGRRVHAGGHADSQRPRILDGFPACRGMEGKHLPLPGVAQSAGEGGGRISTTSPARCAPSTSGAASPIRRPPERPSAFPRHAMPKCSST